MKSIFEHQRKKLNIALQALFLSFLIVGVLGVVSYVLASATSNFTQTIGAGTLAVDIVDGSYATVASPAVAMGAYTFSFSCATSTGTFGTASEQIYVTNPDAADNGWTVTIAASAPTDVWDSAGTDFDFNDDGTADNYGCADSGGDADSLGGRMDLDPNAGTLAAGACATCTTGDITKGSKAYFNEGVTNTITVLTGAAASNDIGDWTLQGVTVNQKIPSEQPAAADYDINLTLSIAAS